MGGKFRRRGGHQINPPGYAVKLPTERECQMESLITVVSVRGIEPKSAPDNLFYIGRRCTGWAESPLCNPTKLARESQRTEAIAQYRRYLWQKIEKDDYSIYTAITRIADMVRRGESVQLGCWCSPRACHGDVVKEAVLWWIANRKT